jgi:hypothetical protein
MMARATTSSLALIQASAVCQLKIAFSWMAHGSRKR